MAGNPSTTRTMMYMSRSQKTPSGFTLIELLVSMGIISFLTLGIVTFQISFLRNTATVQAGLITQEQIRKTFSAFVKEMRTSVPSASGSFSIGEAGTSTLMFYTNIDDDSAIERVRYYLGTSTLASTTILYKEVIEPVGGNYAHANEMVTIAVQDVKFSTSTDIFSYFDANYAGTSSPLVQPVTRTAIRLIRISIPVDPNAARSPVFQTYTTQVSVRNLKDNL